MADRTSVRSATLDSITALATRLAYFSGFSCSTGSCEPRYRRRSHQTCPRRAAGSLVTTFYTYLQLTPLSDADVAGQISLRPADPLAAGFRRSGLSRGLLGPLGLDHIRVTRDHFSQPFPRIPDGQRRYWPNDNEPVAQPNEIQSRYLVAVADSRIAGALARFPGRPSSNPA